MSPIVLSDFPSSFRLADHVEPRLAVGARPLRQLPAHRQRLAVHGQRLGLRCRSGRSARPARRRPGPAPRATRGRPGPRAGPPACRRSRPRPCRSLVRRPSNCFSLSSRSSLTSPWNSLIASIARSNRCRACRVSALAWPCEPLGRWPRQVGVGPRLHGQHRGGPGQRHQHRRRRRRHRRPVPAQPPPRAPGPAARARPRPARRPSTARRPRPAPGARRSGPPARSPSP